MAGGVVRRLWCSLRRRHRLVAVLTGDTVQVVCLQCLAGDEVPLVAPATTSVKRADVEDAMGELLAVAVELRALLERAQGDLAAAHLIERWWGE